MPACGGGEASSGPPPWASSPFSSARVFRDQRDDPAAQTNERPVMSISRQIRWPEYGRPASSVKAGLRPPPSAATALTELAARPLLATRDRRRGPADAGTNCNSTFTEASYTKYLTFPIRPVANHLRLVVLRGRLLLRVLQSAALRLQFQLEALLSLVRRELRTACAVNRTGLS